MYSKSPEVDILLGVGDSDDSSSTSGDEQPTIDKGLTKEPTGEGRKRKLPAHQDNDSDSTVSNASNRQNGASGGKRNSRAEIPQPNPEPQPNREPQPGPAQPSPRRARLRHLQNYFAVRPVNVEPTGEGRKRKLPAHQDNDSDSTVSNASSRQDGASGGKRKSRAAIPQPNPTPQSNTDPQPGPSAAPFIRRVRQRVLQNYFAERNLNVNLYSRASGG